MEMVPIKKNMAPGAYRLPGVFMQPVYVREQHSSEQYTEDEHSAAKPGNANRYPNTNHGKQYQWAGRYSHGNRHTNGNADRHTDADADTEAYSKADTQTNTNTSAEMPGCEQQPLVL